MRHALACLGLALTYLAAPVRAAGPINSGEVAAGSLVSPTYSETWTFAGTAGDRVVIAAVITGGAANSQITLYPPVGPSVLTTVNDRVDYQLLSTGTYSIVVEDQGLNDAGTYAIGLLNVTAGPHTTIPDPDGGAIASGGIVTGQMNAAGDFDAFTFSATNGDRVLIGGLTTGGTLNTTFYLYPPAGGAAQTFTFGDRLDVKLLATGTWTIVMQDADMDSPGTYSLSLLNVTAGPWTSGPDPDGATIASGEETGGQMNAVGDFDAFQFTGNAGDRVLFSALVTSGIANTMATVFPPGGGAAEFTTSADRLDFQLMLTGTYTIVIEDVGQNDTGTYGLSYLNVTSGPQATIADPDGGAIVSGGSVTGQMNVLGDFDAFTFSATNGDRVLIAGITTGGSLNTTYYIYPPGGGAAQTFTFSDRLDVKLLATGTWTIVMQDAENDTPGTYLLSLLNVTAGPWTSGSDPDGATIASGEETTGQMNGVGDFDAFQFAGAAGDRVLFAALATSGIANTMATIFPPGGGPAELTTTADRVDHRLLVSGLYTIVIEDAGQNDTGNYRLGFLNVTSGPLTTIPDPDGGAIASGDVRTGQMNAACDFDAFTFSATNGDRLLFSDLATAGVGFNVTIYLYPPAGGAQLTFTFGDRLDAKLTATGTWTIVVQDAENDTPGSYSLSLLNVTAGPWTTGSDPDGAPLVSGDVAGGTFTTLGDFDAFQFAGNTGDRVLVGSLTTSGAANTLTSIYPPGGGAAEISSSSDRVDHKLLASGVYTIVIEDATLNQAGSYQVGLLDVTSGPLTTPGDPDGGSIHSDEVRSGTSGLVDFDAYAFYAAAGDRILISGVATGGAGYNTQIFLYPPGGAAQAASTFSDRLEFKLTTTGVWTVVVQDADLNTTGSYNASILNLSGPFAVGADPDGGVILPGVPENGNASPIADFDGFHFYGLNGDMVSISAIATSGLLNTQISLYPPGGNAALVSTASDNVNQALAADGFYTIVIEDVGQDNTGGYTLTMNGSGTTSGAGGPEIPGGGPVFALKPASPSPFRQSTTIAFSLPGSGPVALVIYDARGGLVRRLVSGSLEAGPHEIAWDGRDDGGRTVGSGVYYYGLTAGGNVKQGRVVRAGS